MKAAVLHSPRDLRVEDVNAPELGIDEVLINVSYSGICGLDRRIYGGELKVKTPLIIGHEFSGVVAEVGSAVRRFKKDDKVTVYPTIPCNQCVNCYLGRDNQCENIRTVGIVSNGSDAQYAKVPEHAILRLPEGIPMEVGAILGDAAPSAFRAIHERGGVAGGDVVVVIGTGAIAQCCVAFAKARGGYVIVVGRSDRKLEISKRLGADLTVNSLKEDVEKAIKNETAGRGADIAYDVVGSPELIRNALAYVRRAGTAILVGFIPGEASISMRDIMFREKSLLGSLGYRRVDYARMLTFIEKNKIDLSPVITDIIPLSDISKGFNMLDEREGRSVKILLKP